MTKTLTSATALLLAVRRRRRGPLRPHGARSAFRRPEQLRPTARLASPPIRQLPPGFAAGQVPPGPAPEAGELPPPPEPLEDPLDPHQGPGVAAGQATGADGQPAPAGHPGWLRRLRLLRPSGDGSGIVRDNGNAMFPQYAGQYGWVFLGDILATAVNTRGEVADLGDAAGAVSLRQHRLAGGARLHRQRDQPERQLGPDLQRPGHGQRQPVPRSGGDFSIGDFLDVDLAQLEWVLTDGRGTSLFVGKTESLIGIEYRERKSNNRFGITPSLLARYTTGTALGIKLRSKLGPNDFLVLAGAVTNGSNTTEQFHFYDEIDTNAGKTASGRIALRRAVRLRAGGRLLRRVRRPGPGPQQRRRACGSSGSTCWPRWAGRPQGPVPEGQVPGPPADRRVRAGAARAAAYLEINLMVTPWLGAARPRRIPRRLRVAGQPRRPRRRQPRLPDQVLAGTLGLRVVFNERIVSEGGIPAQRGIRGHSRRFATTCSRRRWFFTIERRYRDGSVKS